MAQRIESGKPDEARAILNPEEPDRLLRFEFDRGSNYEADTRLTEALSALIPESELFNADHRLFQVVHLVSEYMWCSMHHELRRVCLALDDDDFGLAARLLHRTVGLADVPVRQRVDGAERAAAGAVGAGEGEEGARRVVPGFVRVDGGDHADRGDGEPQDRRGCGGPGERRAARCRGRRRAGARGTA